MSEGCSPESTGRPLEGVGNHVRRWMITGAQASQNPAYRPTHQVGPRWAPTSPPSHSARLRVVVSPPRNNAEVRPGVGCDGWESEANGGRGSAQLVPRRSRGLQLSPRRGVVPNTCIDRLAQARCRRPRGGRDFRSDNRPIKGVWPKTSMTPSAVSRNRTAHGGLLAFPRTHLPRRAR